ncbi:MAG TPA: hypothetical protein VIC27_01860, partial [Ktedonobacterales bacterium]
MADHREAVQAQLQPPALRNALSPLFVKQHEGRACPQYFGKLHPGAKMTVLTIALYCKLRAASVPSRHMSGFHGRHRPDQIVFP